MTREQRLEDLARDIWGLFCTEILIGKPDLQKQKVFIQIDKRLREEGILPKLPDRSTQR